jgi:hypothetical protein
MNVSNSNAATTCGLTVNTTTQSVCQMFVGEYVMIDSGSNAESVALSAVDTSAKQITAQFANTHAAGASVNVYGGFATGIVPDIDSTGTAYPNGSNGYHLKLYGDINGDGTMLYVEYFCDVNGGNLYRNEMPFDQVGKPANNQASLVLLNGISNNPPAANPTPCFTYMPRASTPDRLAESLGVADPVCSCNTTFVLDVAITLTVNTQQVDPITKKQQSETKALLNVSPRNVFDTWQLMSANWPNNTDRIQPMPPSVQLLLPTPTGQ